MVWAEATLAPVNTSPSVRALNARVSKRLTITVLLRFMNWGFFAEI
jgi:hypothetical protein